MEPWVALGQIPLYWFFGFLVTCGVLVAVMDEPLTAADRSYLLDMAGSGVVILLPILFAWFHLGWKGAQETTDQREWVLRPSFVERALALHSACLLGVYLSIIMIGDGLPARDALIGGFILGAVVYLALWGVLRLGERWEHHRQRVRRERNVGLRR